MSGSVNIRSKSTTDMTLPTISLSIRLMLVSMAMAGSILPARGDLPLPVPKPGLVIVQVVDGDAETNDDLDLGMKVYDGYDFIGLTDKKHRAALRLPPGPHRIAVLQPSMRAGREYVEVRSGETHRVEVIVKAGEALEVAFPYRLAIDQAPILRSDTTVFSGAVYDDRGRIIKFKDLQFYAAVQSGTVDLDQLLEILPDGRFRSRVGADLSPLLALDGPINLSFSADAEAGYSLREEEYRIMVGRYSVKGRLSPQQPKLPVAHVPLKVMFESVAGPFEKSIEKTVELQTDSTGSFEVTHVPLGRLKIEAKAFVVDGVEYQAGGTILVDSDKAVLMRIRRADDHGEEPPAMEVTSIPPP